MGQARVRSIIEGVHKLTKRVPYQQVTHVLYAEIDCSKLPRVSMNTKTESPPANIAGLYTRSVGILPGAPPTTGSWKGKKTRVDLDLVESAPHGANYVAIVMSLKHGPDEMTFMSEPEVSPLNPSWAITLVYEKDLDEVGWIEGDDHQGGVLNGKIRKVVFVCKRGDTGVESFIPYNIGLIAWEAGTDYVLPLIFDPAVKNDG